MYGILYIPPFYKIELQWDLEVTAKALVICMSVLYLSIWMLLYMYAEPNKTELFLTIKG